MNLPTVEQVRAVWKDVRCNSDARKALAKLKRDGFAIDHLTPGFPKYLCWADYVALIPFLPNRRSRRQIHRGQTLRKHLSLLKSIRQFAAKTRDPFCEVRVAMKSETLLEASLEFGVVLEKAADLIERFISANWTTRHRNPRHALIAELRWTIRSRTGAPHDSELATLIDAALISAGRDGIALIPAELDRIEKREKEGRVKAACRLNYVSGKSPSPFPGRSFSTKISKNRGKRG